MKKNFEIKIDYWPNGQVMYKTYFIYNKLFLRIGYYENGTLSYFSNKNKKVNSWYQNGQLEYEISYLNVKESLTKRWHENGKLNYEFICLNREKHRLEIEWDHDGQIICNTSWKKNLEHGAKVNFQY